MTAVHGIEQALAGSRGPLKAGCQGCAHDARPAEQQQVVAAGRIDTQMSVRWRAGDIGQAFAASLSRRVGGDVAGAQLPAYATDSSPVSGFLRAVAGRLASASTPEQGEAIIVGARAAVASASAEVQPLVRAGGALAQAAHRALAEALQTGLDRLQHSPVTQSGNDISAETQTTTVRELRAKLSLNIRTADGDVVRLRVRASHAMGAESETLHADDGSITRTQAYVSSDTRVRVDVRGHLDADELSAVHDVIAQVDEVARSLLNGDFDSAMKALGALELDRDELSQMVLHTRVREQLRLAASARRTVTPATVPAAPAAAAGAAPAPAAPPTPSHPTRMPSPGTQAASPRASAPALAARAPVAESAAPARDLAPAMDTMRQAMSGLATVLHQFISSTRMDVAAGEGGLRLRIEQHFIGSLLQSLMLVREQSLPPAGASGAPVSQHD